MLLRAHFRRQQRSLWPLWLPRQENTTSTMTPPPRWMAARILLIEAPVDPEVGKSTRAFQIEQLLVVKDSPRSKQGTEANLIPGLLHPLVHVPRNLFWCAFHLLAPQVQHCDLEIDIWFLNWNLNLFNLRGNAGQEYIFVRIILVENKIQDWKKIWSALNYKIVDTTSFTAY